MFSTFTWITPKDKTSKKKMSTINIAQGKNDDRDCSRVSHVSAWVWVECQYCFQLLASPTPKTLLQSLSKFLFFDQIQVYRLVTMIGCLRLGKKHYFVQPGKIGKSCCHFW